MGIDKIAVDTTLLKSDVDSMQEELHGIRTELDLVYSSMQELDRMWEGAANESFMQQFGQDHEDMVKVCGIIQSMIDFMGEAKQEYESAEREVSMLVSAVRI